MDVTNAKEAREWLRCWGQKPPRGILGAAIDGTQVQVSYAAERQMDDMEFNAREALGVLRLAFFKLTGRAYVKPAAI